MVKIVPIPVFTDNYIWLVHNQQNAIVVDPGLAAPVQQYLKRHNLTLQAVLVTHCHYDHIGGITELCQATSATVYLPNNCPPFKNQYILPQETIVEIPTLALKFHVWLTPGHTSEHISFYCEQLSALFCGDTIFSAGCGRINDSSATMLFQSLQRIATLPKHTNLYCTHEYTLDNLRFSQYIEPVNIARDHYITRCQQQRNAQQPTLPTTVENELDVNPFLRLTRQIKQRIQQEARKFNHIKPLDSELDFFTALRQLKDVFK